MAVLNQNPDVLLKRTNSNTDFCIVSASNVKQEYITDPVPWSPKTECEVSLVKNESGESLSAGKISQLSPSWLNETHEVATEVKQEATSPAPDDRNLEDSGCEERSSISSAQQEEAQGGGNLSSLSPRISLQHSDAVVEREELPFRAVEKEPTPEEVSQEYDFALLSTLTATDVSSKNQNEFSHFPNAHHCSDTIKRKNCGLLEDPSTGKLYLQQIPMKSCANEKFLKEAKQPSNSKNSNVINDVRNSSADRVVTKLLKLDWYEDTEENEQSLDQVGPGLESSAVCLAENKDGLESLPRISGSVGNFGGIVGTCSNMNKCSLNRRSETSLNMKDCTLESLRSSSFNVNEHFENHVSDSGVFERGFENYARISLKNSEVSPDGIAQKSANMNETGLKNQGGINLIKEEPGVESDGKIMWIKKEPSFECQTKTILSTNEKSVENDAGSNSNWSESSSVIQIGPSWSLSECSFEDETRTCLEPCLYSGYSSEDSDTSSSVRPFPSQTKKLSCSKCQKQFSLRNELTVDSVEHKGKISPMCCKCRQAYALKKHAVVPRDKQRYACAHCSAVFVEKMFLRRHLREVHSDSKRISCELCLSSFKTVAKLNQHAEKFHSTPRQFSCSWCSMAFCERSDFLRHRQKHRGKRQYICILCSEVFKAEMHLITHSMQVHSKTKPFICNLCLCAFSRVGDLKRHVTMRHAKDFKTNMRLVSDLQSGYAEPF